MRRGLKTKYPDIYRLPNGDILVRAQARDPATGKPRDTTRRLTSAKALAAGHGDLLEYALQYQRSLISELSRTAPAASRTRFGDYAQRVIDDRIALGKIASPETKMKNANSLRLHIGPVWGDMFVDAIRRSDVEKWLVTLGKYVQARKYTPETVNTWWRLFKMVMRRAAATFEIKDPTDLLEGIPTSAGPRTYTDEEPNSLLPSELPAFFEAAWTHEREHFAMLALGQLTGRRACELRPLRREGPNADIAWETGRMLIRRSQTIGEAMDVTKTKRDVVLFLPPTVLDILRTHVANLTPYRLDSELLFPPRHPRLEGTAGYMSKSALDKPIRRICEKAGIKKNLTAKGAMRRTYQDLCRAAEVSDVVQMAMSGHATQEMKQLYSTASEDAKRQALTRMSAIAGLNEAARL